MNTVTLDDAQQHLAELVRDLARGGELLITVADKPVAKLSSVAAQPSLTSQRKMKPNSVGAVLRPFPSPEDDISTEILDADTRQ